MHAAADSGTYDLPRRYGSDHITPVNGMTATIMTRLDSSRRVDGTVVNVTDPWLLTQAEIAGRRQALEVRPFPRRSECLDTSMRGWPRSAPRLVSEKHGGCTATTG